MTQPRSDQLLTHSLRLNVLALAFSLTHVMGDYGIVRADLDSGSWLLWGYLALAGGIYGWWAWSLMKAAGDGRSGLMSLAVLSGFWAVLNGATFPFTALTNLPADVIHFGSLVFGVWAALATWRLMRAYPMTPEGMVRTRV